MKIQRWTWTKFIHIEKARKQGKANWLYVYFGRIFIRCYACSNNSQSL